MDGGKATMIRGFIVTKMGAAIFYGPDMLRGGLVGIWSGTGLGEIGATTLVVEIEHRNADQTSYALLGTVATVTAAGTPFSTDLGPVQEIWRYKYSFSGGSDGDGFRMELAAPSWLPS